MIFRGGLQIQVFVHKGVIFFIHVLLLALLQAIQTQFVEGGPTVDGRDPKQPPGMNKTL